MPGFYKQHCCPCSGIPCPCYGYESLIVTCWAGKGRGGAVSGEALQIAATPLCRALTAARENARVKAVVLRLDSIGAPMCWGRRGV